MPPVIILATFQRKGKYSHYEKQSQYPRPTVKLGGRKAVFNTKISEQFTLYLKLLFSKPVSDGLNYLILAVNTKECVLHLIYFEEGWGSCECNWPGVLGISDGDTLLCFRTEKEKLLGCKKNTSYYEALQSLGFHLSHVSDWFLVYKGLTA